MRQVVEAGVERDDCDAGHSDVDEALLPRLEQVDGRRELVLAVPKLEALLHGGEGAVAAVRHLVSKWGWISERDRESGANFRYESRGRKTSLVT